MVRFHCLDNSTNYAIYIVHHIIIPKAEHPVAFDSKYCVRSSSYCGVIVLHVQRPLVWCVYAFDPLPGLPQLAITIGGGAIVSWVLAVIFIKTVHSPSPIHVL